MAAKRAFHQSSAIFYSVVGVFGLSASAFLYADDLRDPTTPLHQAPRSASHVDLVLSAIADVGGRSFAIVNDRRVYVGDSVSGAIIEKISENYVVYSYQGKQYTLKMRLSLIE
ncbi:MAG TPA: hypothetical protein VIC26_12920 [Marinagarivorans sp.]